MSGFGGYGGGGGGGEYGGGGGGGGFTHTYGGSQGGSQASPGSASKEKKSGTIRPVTIKQVLECNPNHQFENNNTFKIDDVEISHITLVARVRNVTEQATNINYVIDDGTGQCDVKQWIDADNAPDGSAQQLNGQYIRVIGQLKTFGSKRHIGAHAIRPITDYNEVQYHILETVAIHLHITRGPPEQYAPQGDGATSYNKGGGDTAMGGMGGYGAAAGGANNKLPAGTSQAARIVFETIRSQGSENNEGMHVQIISQRTKMIASEVGKAVDELLSLGVAFTTLDDNHVAVMDF